MILFYLTAWLFLVFSLNFFILGLLFMYMNYKLLLNWNLLVLNSVDFSMLIYLDWLSLIFIFTVLLISSMIFFYCCEYMSHDYNINRFFYLIFLFVVSMILMIISPSILTIILGWDGLGLISYGLVIYYQSNFSYNSGMLTVLMNRIGDIMIILSISVMFILGSWNFLFYNNFLNYFLFSMIIVASFTKSAQFPFSSWLPAAMAAPTPVSSLVHSSTLVTAGVYMLIRFNNLIYLNDSFLNFIVCIGMLTMMFAGLSALSEYDLKKIIAYSTLSQLGLMMVIYGMKFYVLSFFHLIIHAMFKSMMFMCSGVFIHSLLNYQDIRFMGNLIEFMPLTLMIFMVANFSLCGMPFFSGFYSKDLILEKIFMSSFSMILYLFLLLSTGLTVMYSIRVLYYLSYNNFNFLSFKKITDTKLMNFSMFLLLLNSLMSGYLMNWLIFLNIEEIYLFSMEKIQILVLCVFMVFFFNFLFKLSFKVAFPFYFFGKMWMLYYMNFYLNFYNLSVMKKFYNVIDKGYTTLILEKSLVEFIKKLNLNFRFYSLNLLISLMFSLSYLIVVGLMVF
uniref:NADH-ubiquinone oxidoreductase chain 5 n=1 Tax=Encyrtus rhodococcusiae TaxID=1914889 RepID=A0A7S5FMW0_9HYME|nr:NADH dehydrogenase subunit 5 [Encyrtus rhodococcusiae]QGA74521.1 NADH dehydrogenase subunit 5 [Encyrtus rhodococcusiae]QGA74533.1 NADH dehydrogenase subunit 5 [Encyrtus rhodococcusiae]QGA74547.1 NADH dehydrogenase subunit 5 [Encyrtus rhodococcusiae]